LHTTQTVSTAVDETVAATETTVQSLVSGPVATTQQTVQQVASAAARPSATPAPTTTTETAEQPIVGGEVAASTGKPSAESVLPFTSVHAVPLAPTRASNPTRPSRGRHFTATLTQRPTPAATVAGTGPPMHSPWSLERAPQKPMPGLPSSVTTLLGGSGASGSLLVAALLSALLLAAFGRPGARLRPRAEIFRLPDVLFQLERPG
jgi:hypothetical protein